MQKSLAQIPNLLTLLNLVFGCVAIVYILQNGIAIVDVGPSPENPLGKQLELLPQAIYLAPLFIGLAALADFFDGFAARLLNVQGELGKQLDSLADVVSFGVAPSLIIYQFLRLAYAGREGGLESSIIWLMPAFLLAAAAAYRLGKFNLDTRQTHHFRGTPVPSVGLMVATLPLIYWSNNSDAVLSLFRSVWFWYGLVAVLSWLMISDIPIMANKPRERTTTGMLPQLLLVAIAIISALILGWWAGPVTFAAFVLLSVIFKNRIV